MNNRCRAYVVSLAAGGILAAGLAFYIIIGKDFFQIPPCLIYEKTGLWCPACGGTRAVLALLDGRIVPAFWWNPVVPYGVFLYLAYILEETRERIFRSRYRVPMRFWKACVGLGLLLLAGNCLLRNLLLFVHKSNIFS